jgi:hypothetical protein
MLSISTLYKKPETVNQNGEGVVDLTAATFVYNTDVVITGSGMVSDELEMRVDLVAKIYYGDVSKLDFICKFNGISNPFSLEAGTILLIGDKNGMEANFTNPTGKQTSDAKQADIRAKFFDANRLSKKDVKRLELVKKKSAEFANAASNLPPNMAPVGSLEMKSKDGVVIFGGDVVANKDNCPTPLSRAVVKAKLLEQKTFKNG